MSSPRDVPPVRSTEERDVELWCPSLDRWVRGFSVVRRDGPNLVIRRRSDRALLPVPFVESDVRPIDGG
jgi:hypothetical protein